MRITVRPTVRLHHRQPVVVVRLPRARPTRFPALDGLRCLAVVVVILSHADLSWARGGFIGVDVFFVLSGYLITGQLWTRAVLSGRVDLVGFWTARVRRLAPALVVVLLAAAVAMLVAGRDQLSAFRGDFLAALTYTSNWWYILGERSYFESAGRPPVLQHLWSLAIEEQFYLAWPLLLCLFLALAMTWRTRRSVLLGIIGLALVSALIMAVGSSVDNVPYDSDGSRWYFGTDSHAFGLLLGAASAVFRHGDGLGGPTVGLRRGTSWLGPLGVAGIVTILAATVWLDRQRVLLSTVHVARPWQDDNLQLLRSMPGRYSNVRLVDWNAFATANQNLLYDDGIHMRPQGATAYAKLIAEAATAP